MAKKSFKGLDAFLDGAVGTVKRPGGTIDAELAKPAEEKRPLARTSLMIDVDLLKQMKAIAYLERKTMRGVLDDALNYYFENKGKEVIDEACQLYEASAQA